MSGPAQFPLISSRAVKAIILEELDAALDSSWVNQVANRYTSDQASETYAGTGNVAPMREWIGPKQAIPINVGSTTITNKDWESTLLLNEKDLRRDKTGQLKMKAGELAIRGRQHIEKILSALIDTGDDGDIGLAFDGQYFFDTDHSFGSSGTINNDITFDVATTTAPTPVEAADAILAGIQALYGFKDDQGEPSNGNLKNFTVMVPTPFWASFSTAANLQFLTSGQSNKLKGMDGINLNIVVNQRSTWTTSFAIFATDRITKPFIIQTEVAPYLESLERGSDFWFANHAELYSVVSADNVGYQRFDGAILVTLV
jgi:phage major head subunit gpT-like protein